MSIADLNHPCEITACAYCGKDLTPKGYLRQSFNDNGVHKAICWADDCFEKMRLCLG